MKPNTTNTVQLDGYNFGDRLLEGVMFIVTIHFDGSKLKVIDVQPDKKAEEYLSKLNRDKALKDAKDFAERNIAELLEEHNIEIPENCLPKSTHLGTPIQVSSLNDLLSKLHSKT